MMMMMGELYAEMVEVGLGRDIGPSRGGRRFFDRLAGPC